MLPYADDMAMIDKSSPRVRAIYDSIPKIISLESYNNYITRNPFSKSGNFSCDLSLDYVRFFLDYGQHSHSDIKTLFTSLNVPFYLVNAKKGPFRLPCNGVEYPAHFATCIIDGHYIGTLLRINQPSYTVLKHIHHVLGGRYLLNQAEFTADLGATNLDDLFGIIKNTLRLKWPGQHLNLDVDTIYANNIRKTRSLGCKGYIKEKANGDFARIEMTAKRPFFRDNKVQTIDDLQSLTGDFIFKRLEFCQLKKKALDRKIAKRSRIEYPQLIGNVSIGWIAEAFYHASVADHIQYGVADMGRVLKDWLTKGVYQERHPFHKFFFQKVTGRTFI